MTNTETIEITASRTRLIALCIFAFFCFGGGMLNISPLISGEVEFSFWAYVFIGFCGLFFLWGVAAGWVALTQPKIAYRATADGLYLGTQDQPAFTWDQVRGATLVRGKRRSSIIIILENSNDLNLRGALPSWLATFLGRPTDRDMALTNMDTTLDLGTFLDLIGPYFHTYGPGKIEEKH